MSDLMDELAADGDHEPETNPVPEPAPIIDVHGLAKSSGGGPAYRNVDVTADRGDLVVLRGAEGSGKTMLLLGLLGRMGLEAGSGTVDGHDVRRQARRIRENSGVANVTLFTGLDSSLTVREHVAERIIMNRPWYLPVAGRKAVAQVIDQCLAIASDVNKRLADLPEAAVEQLGLTHRPDFRLDPDLLVSEIDDIQQLALEILLACISPAELIGVDDIDLLRRRDDRMWAWVLLLELSGIRALFGPDTTTVIATCQETTELDLLLDAIGDHADGFASVRRVDLTKDR